jgi:hypothetical protein
MHEQHHVTGQCRGEPLPARHVGVRVRVPLSGTPSARWARVVSSRLMSDLTGHRGVGHMHFNHIVQGSEIVLDGVEEPEADCLGEALGRAIEAANEACRRFDMEPPPPGNVSQEVAERIASKVSVRAPSLPS